MADAGRPTLSDLTEAVRRFRDERDWRQFHKPKDLAISIAIESAELLEHFQWKDDAEIARHLSDTAEHAAVEAELADILLLLVSTADALEIDLLDAAFRKLARNAEKYPVDLARGRADKYDRL